MASAVVEGVVLRPARPEDLPQMLALLEASDLPTAGVAEWLSTFLVAESEGRIAGAIGLEIYGSDGLLRSAVVSPGLRGRGVGAALTEGVLALARERGLATVYLLTQTAADYFPRHGFRRITRAEVSEAVQQSVEFRELCPVSSTVMALTLAGGEGA